MIRGWPALLLLAALPACVMDEAMNRPARNAATDAYAACTMDAVRRLDDGRSDPASVAMGVAGACSGQYAAITNTMTDELITEKGQQNMREQMRANELRTATTAVLTYRAAQRR